MDAISGSTHMQGLAPFETRWVPAAKLDQMAAQMEMAQTLSPQQFATFNSYLNGTVGNIDNARFANVDPAMATMFGGSMDPAQMMMVGQLMQQQQMTMMLAMMLLQQMQMMQMLMMMMSSPMGGIDPRLLQMLMSGVQDPAWPPQEQRPGSEVYQDEYEKEIEAANESAKSIDPQRMKELNKIEEELYAQIVGDGPETLSPSEKIDSVKDADAAYKAFESKLHPALAKAQKDGRLQSIHERHHAEHTLKAKFCAALADRLREAEKAKKDDECCDEHDGEKELTDEYKDRSDRELEEAQEAGRNVDPARIAKLTRLERRIYEEIVGEKGALGLAPGGKIESREDAEAAEKEFESRLGPALHAAQENGDLKTVHERAHAEHSLRAQFLLDISDHFRGDDEKKDDEQTSEV